MAQKKRRVRAAGSITHGVRYTRTAGIDTDKDMLVTAFYDVNAPATQIDEFPQSNPGIAALIQKLKARDIQAVIIESTGQFHMNAYNRMAAAGLNVLVVNPLAIKALLRVEGKSDQRDAATLARLGATFDLRPSNMPNEEQTRLRYLFKVYDQAVATRMMISNRLGAVLTAHGCRLMSEFGRTLTRERLIQLFLDHTPTEQIGAAHPLANRRQAVSDCLQDVHMPEFAYSYARHLFAEYRRHCEIEVKQAHVILNEFEPLKNAVLFAATVPGSTPELLIRLVAECGTNFTERYSTADRFCSALGTAPRSEVSGGKLPKISDTHGNARMITALAAHYKAYLMHIKGAGPLAEWLTNYRARASYSKTLLALCHHVTPAWWHCTKLQVPYDEYTAFGQQRPHHQMVDAVVGTVDTETGEILDDAPIAVGVPSIVAFMRQAQADLSPMWHYQHNGD